MKIMHIQGDNIPKAWPHAVKWLEKANEKGKSRYPLDDTLRDIRDGKKLLFKCVSGNNFGWLVLGCVENSQNRTAIVYMCGGKGVLEFLDDITAFCEAYALHNKCQYITCSGRAGWTKELAKYGWGEISRTCGKEL